MPAIPKALRCIFEASSALWGGGATYFMWSALLDAVSAIENVGNITKKKNLKKRLKFFSVEV